MRPAVFDHPPFPDHALLDSGEGEKLERFGEVVLARPDPQALWRRRLPEEAWRGADLTFVRESDRGGRWEARRGAHAAARGQDPQWSVGFDDGTFLVRPTPFKHVGIFPEQAANWLWVRSRVGLFPGRGNGGSAGGRNGGSAGEQPRLLNLFGYTGAASALAAQAGYRVTHVDASKTSLAWARENFAASGLPDDAIRVVLEDARSFARREARRGNRYEGILVDPPHYGRGPKGETWRFEEDVAALLTICGELLAERAFLVVSAYAIGFLPTAFVNLLRDLGLGQGTTLEAGELGIPEEPVDGAPTRVLSGGMCARWSRGL